MDKGQQHAQWDHTALIVATLRQVFGDSSATVESIHPAHARQHNARELRKAKQQHRKKSDRKPKGE